MATVNDFKVSVSSEYFARRQNYWIVGYSIFAIFFLGLHFIIELKIFRFWDDYIAIIKKLTLSLFYLCIIFIIGKFIEKLIVKGSQSEGNRYNLVRITRLVTAILSIILVVSFLSQNFNLAIASLGLASLVLGFALQAPISNFIGWVYIVFRNPYQVGDRIQIGKYRGDVLKIDYLDTLMMEFSGEYLSNDRLSGRLITFPNNHVFKSEILNYSGPFVPFIWNETGIQIAYNADIEFVQQCLMEAAQKDFITRYTDFRQEAEEWKPDVYFRINSYAWLEAVVSYPVKPKDTTPRRSAIIKQAMKALNAQPDKARLPEGVNR